MKCTGVVWRTQLIRKNLYVVGQHRITFVYLLRRGKPPLVRKTKLGVFCLRVARREMGRLYVSRAGGGFRFCGEARRGARPCRGAWRGAGSPGAGAGCGRAGASAAAAGAVRGAPAAPPMLRARGAGPPGGCGPGLLILG